MMNSFANELSIFRKRKGLSQNDLAKAISYDRSYISKLENGERIPSERNVVIKIADYLKSDEYMLNKLLILADFEPELNSRESYKACLKIIDELKSKGMLEKAKNIISSIKAKSDNKFDYSIILAYSHLLEKNYEKALELYAEAINSYDQDKKYKLAITKAEVIHNFGNVYFEKGLNLKTQLEENTPDYDSLKAECLNNFFHALENFKKALSLQPKHFHIIDQIARISLNISSLKKEEKVFYIEQAIIYYEKLLELDSDDISLTDKKFEASIYIALSYARIEKFHQAKNIINIMINTNAENPQLYYMKALIYSLSGKNNLSDLEISFSALKKAIEINKDYLKKIRISNDLSNLKNNSFFRKELEILSDSMAERE